jgi:hypothetical protein
VLPSLNFPQLDFVKPLSGFHPVIWERVRITQEGLKMDDHKVKSIFVTTLVLGSRPRQRGCKGAGQEEAGCHITYSRECKKV